MMIPARLGPKATVRVVAPSRSLAMISPQVRAVAGQRFLDMGLQLTFGDYVEEVDEFVSSSIEHRVADLHAAFADPEVDAILSVIGGFNSNQMLPYLDWDLIAANPKIICGYSDITALSCSLYAKTGLVTYSGPHYCSFGMEAHFSQTLEWFRAALFVGGEQSFQPAATWSDDEWFLDQRARAIEPNEGHWILQSGQADGVLIGGNLCTLNLLHGTQYMPSLADAIVFVEDDYESDPHTFDRDLTSLTQQPDFGAVRGLLIGRFQRQVDMTRSKLEAIIRSKRELRGMPVIANLDFGHTDPIMTVPVGCTSRIEAADSMTWTIDFG